LESARIQDLYVEHDLFIHLTQHGQVDGASDLESDLFDPAHEVLRALLPRPIIQALQHWSERLGVFILGSSFSLRLEDHP